MRRRRRRRGALPRCLSRYLSGLRKACAGADDFHRPGESGCCREARGTMQASSPTHARACRVLQDIFAAGRRCTPQSADADSSPCRGAFGKLPQKSLPCKGRCHRKVTEGCGTLPGLYTCGMFALRAPGATPASARAVCAADRQRDDASIVPYACKVRPCRGLWDISAAGWRCTPQSADADSSPCRGAFGKLPQKSLPCKGRCHRKVTEGCGTLPGLYTCGMFALRAPGATPASARAVCAADRQRDDASIVPYACKVRPCRGLWDISAAGWRCTPQSADADSSPCRGAFGKLPQKSLPCKGRCHRKVTEGCGTLPGLYTCGMLALRAGRRALSNS